MPLPADLYSVAPKLHNGYRVDHYSYVNTFLSEPVTAPHAPAIIIPVYNHGRQIGEVVRKARQLNLPIFVIYDGSTDTTPEVLASLDGITGITVLFQRTRFESAHRLEKTLIRYLHVYSFNITQVNIGHITPVKALDKWRKTHPDLFEKSESNPAGLDSYSLMPVRP
ncbi:MAG: glycosyltransferase [Candidatus Electrothrix sp. LOE2]|nr:glycosyltransferase [Candidatus Electrothrix sp. LOE2]